MSDPKPTYTELINMIDALASELEDEIRAKCCDRDGNVFPGSRRYYDRDMETVTEARRLVERVQS